MLLGPTADGREGFEVGSSIMRTVRSIEGVNHGSGGARAFKGEG